MIKLSRRIQIALSPEKGKELDQEAELKGMPTATLIRSIVYRYLANSDRKK